jgi:hypothetical protein
MTLKETGRGVASAGPEQGPVARYCEYGKKNLQVPDDPG